MLSKRNRDFQDSISDATGAKNPYLRLPNPNKDEIQTMYDINLSLSLQYLIKMCFDCPQQIPPPTEELKRCRNLLQGVAASLFIVSLFALLCGEIFFMLMLGLLAYALYLGWAQFNYSITLYIFIYCSLHTLISYVEMIGLIQYYGHMMDQNAAKCLFIFVKFLFFPNALFFTHYAYRHFKHYAQFNRVDDSLSGYQMMPMLAQQRANNPMNPMNQPQSYSNYAQPREEPASYRGFLPFQGQGTAIG